MLLGSLMLGFGVATSYFIHPCSQIATAIQSTHSRCCRLSTLVELTPSVLFQYNCQQFRELQCQWTSLSMDLANTSGDILDDTHSIPPDQTENLSPSKAEEADPSSLGDHFFLSYNSHSELEGDIAKLDFFPAQEPLAPTPSPLDWLGLHEICNGTKHVYLSSSTKHDWHLLPSPAAYNAGLLLGQVDLLHASSSAKFPVIFDSGATLAISPDKNDFAGAIRPLHNRHLGGMANGLIIEGIGRIEWGFKTPTNQVMVIHSECYYVPDAKVWLLSPQ